MYEYVLYRGRRQATVSEVQFLNTKCLHLKARASKSPIRLLYKYGITPPSCQVGHRTRKQNVVTSLLPVSSPCSRKQVVVTPLSSVVSEDHKGIGSGRKIEYRYSRKSAKSPCHFSTLSARPAK